jgi:hypothetical protein
MTEKHPKNCLSQARESGFLHALKRPVSGLEKRLKNTIFSIV